MPDTKPGNAHPAHPPTASETPGPSSTKPGNMHPSQSRPATEPYKK
jgi:hypothetical protein